MGWIGGVSLLPALLLAGATLAGCPPWQATRVRVGDQVYQVEVAADPAQRQEGLSDRDALPPEHGMWFVMAGPGPHAFWMRDMAFALDLVSVTPDLHVLGAARLPPCGAEPCPLYLTPWPTAYVLEVNAGGFAGRVGDRVSWDCPR